MKKVFLYFLIFVIISPVLSAAVPGKIYVNGDRFEVCGQRIWMNGCNTPWDNWNDFGGSYDGPWWNTHFNNINTNYGVNSSRVWITCSGETGINIDSTGYVSGGTAAHWADLDSYFQYAEDNGIYVMAALISFDHFKDTYTTYQSWRNWINSDANIDSYITNYLMEFLTRYGNSDVLWSIDLCNEPDWSTDTEGGVIPWARHQAYWAKAAKAIHENSTALVTVGMGVIKYNSDASGMNGNMASDSALQAITGDADSYMDFWSPHYYSWQETWFGIPFYESPVSYGLTGDRPAVVGECPSTGSTGHTITEDYENAYLNGWQGVMPWTSNGVDVIGDITDMGPGTIAFRDNHYSLVFPECGTPTFTQTINPANTQTFTSTITPTFSASPTPMPFDLIYDGDTAPHRLVDGYPGQDGTAVYNETAAGVTGNGWESVFTSPNWWQQTWWDPNPYPGVGANTEIVFEIKQSDTSPGAVQQLLVKVNWGDGVDVAAYLEEGGSITTSWKTVRIPLSVLGSPAEISNIAWICSWDQDYSIVVDNIRLEGAIAPTPTNTPNPLWSHTFTPTSTPTVDISEIPGFYVSGRFLYSPCGEKVIPYGVNAMSVWHWEDRDGSYYMNEIAQSGANIVRIVWTMENDAGDFTNATPADLDAVIQSCIDNNMIPMIENHYATGDITLVDEVVNWWTKPEIVSVIQKHEKYLLVNIANEAGNGSVSDADFVNVYTDAVTAMRAAGIRVPLIIDGTSWGQNIDILQANWSTLRAADPLHNLMFSVHMWWPAIYGYTAQDVIDEIAESVSIGIPLIVGEFSKDDPSCTSEIPYQTIMQECVENEIGYLPWSWGLEQNTDCIRMGMTCAGDFSTLGDQQPCDYGSGPVAIGDNTYALTVVNDPNYGITANAVIPQYLLDGFTCGGAPTDTPTDTPTDIPTDTPTDTPTDIPTDTPTDTPTQTAVDTDTFTNTPTETLTDTPALTVSQTATMTATETGEIFTPTNTNTSSPENTFTRTPTITLTPTFTLTFTSTFTLTPEDTPTTAASSTGTPTLSFTPTFTLTSTATFTLSATQTASSTFTMTRTGTNTPALSPTPSYTGSPPTSTFTPTVTKTPTFTGTATFTPTFSATGTATQSNTEEPISQTPTPTATATQSQTPSPTFTMTHTGTNTPVFSPTPSYTGTPPTATFTPTVTMTPTFTGTVTFTPTFSTTGTPSYTFTATLSVTATPTPTFTLTATFTPEDTLTITPTFTETFFPSSTVTQTNTPEASSTPTESDILEIATQTPVIVYPNPNPKIKEEGVTLKFNITRKAEKMKVKMYTSASRLVRELELSSVQVAGGLSQGEVRVNLPAGMFAGLSRGVYFYIVIAEDRDGNIARSNIEKILIMN